MLFLVGILAAWIVFEYRSRNKRYEPPERNVVRCPICAHLYVADRDEPVVKCPRCGSLE